MILCHDQSIVKGHFSIFDNWPEKILAVAISARVFDQIDSNRQTERRGCSHTNIQEHSYSNLVFVTCLFTLAIAVESLDS